MALKLEVFETDLRLSSRATVVLDTATLEEERLAAFDKGYAAGWEDANAALANDQTRIRDELARHLQSLSFTYNEARAHVLHAVEPLLIEIVGRLLPEIAREAMAPVVLEALMPMTEQLADAPVSLVLNPAARPSVETLLEHATGLPVTILEEPTLGEGQAYLRVGGAEVHVDLDKATAEIAAAVRGFFDIKEKERRHG